jgi:putative ABC transport system permease protein
MQWVDAVRARMRLLFRPRAADTRMDVEFGLHVDLEVERLMREQGLRADEARRRALAAFGGIQQHKASLRDGRGLAWLGGLALDLKLGGRMLARYPALTLVGGAAMAFGIATGVVGFEVRTQLVDPAIPLDEGSRIVGLRIWDASLNRTAPSTVADVEAWRTRLTRVEDVSAFRSFDRNLITSDGRGEPEAVAAMTASAFRVARMAPLFGRTLLDADDRPGAPPVVVIGHEVWTRRFGANPAVLGEVVRLGSEHPTVVGVMPPGFRFPTAHGLWIPLRPEMGARKMGPGLILRTTKNQTRPHFPGPNFQLFVFGRLADEASRAEAQAELSATGLGALDGSPDGREHQLPQLVPYSWLQFDPQGLQIALTLGNTFAVMLLVLVSANVALLMFARAASRETEIAVRGALGAGRARIVVQLFLEALVLASVAVAVGLAAARIGLDSMLAARAIDSERPLPFWVTADLTPTTMIYAAVLTIISAAIIGILPALIATGRDHQARLRQASARSGGVRFGGMWTVAIAAQVATTVVFPAAAFVFHRAVVAGETQDVGVPADRFLSARLDLEAGSRRTTFAELERRVSAESAVTGLTFADRLPGTLHPLWRIESEGDTPGSTPARHQAVSASVAVNFFDVLGVPIVAGRGFTAADIDASFGVAIVNQSFVTSVFGGRNPVGRRVRRQARDGTEQPGSWLEIIGVVKDLGMNGNTKGAGFYLPASLEKADTLRTVVGVNTRPESFAARFRTITGEVDPTLQIHELMSLDDVGASQWNDSQFLARVLAVLSGVALLLSLTAIYAVTAFAVTKRTREIGIRVALGASRHRVVGVLIRRPLFQLVLGTAVGSVLVALLVTGLFEEPPSPGELGLIGVYSLAMMIICLVACLVPAGRALRAEPAEVLGIDA